MDKQLALALIVTIAASAAILATLMFFLISRDSRRALHSERYILSADREYINRQIDTLFNKVYQSSGQFDRINQLVEESTSGQSFLVEPSKSVHRSLEVARSSNFLRSLGVNTDAVEIDNNQVFYLTPFSKYHLAAFNVTQSVCADLGLRCIRGDEESVSGNLLPYIVQQIIRSRFVIANITGRNANVFYELGIAQMLEKRALLISSSEEDIEFDLRQQQIVIYSGLNDLRPRLYRAIAQSVMADDGTYRNS